MNHLLKNSFTAILCASAIATAIAANGSEWNNRMPNRNAHELQQSGMPQRYTIIPGTHQATTATKRLSPSLKSTTETTAILTEDFRLMTSGSDGSPDLETNIVGSEGYIYPDYVQTYGWAGINVFQAGGCCYLSDGTTAFINTPFLDLTGIDGTFTINVSFRAATDNGRFFIAWGTGASMVDMRYANATTEWASVEVACTGGTEDMIIQLAGDVPVYIDDIIISQEVEVEEPTSIDAPATLSASDITETGFTANWSIVSAATGYYLDVYYYTTDNERVYALTDHEVATTTCTVDNLEPGHIYYFTVQAYNDLFTSVESAQVIVKEASASIGTPTALPATEISDEGFRANWTEAENAAWYTLYTYSYHTIAETGTFQLENETFDKITEGTMDEPLYNDLESVLNDYTEHPDWTGITSLRAVGMIGLRNYYSIMGAYSFLYSPVYIVESSAPGQVTVKVTAARDNACSDATQIGVTAVNVYTGETTGWQTQTFSRSAEVFEFTLDAFDNYYIAITFADENNADYGMTGTVWIDNVEISQQLNAGDQLCRLYACDIVYGGNSFYVGTPGNGDRYSYFLQASTNGSDGLIESDFSNEVNVGGWSAVADVTGNTDGIKVYGTQGTVNIELPESLQIDIFNLSGSKVATVAGTQGINRIALPQGMYLVNTGNATAKAIVK